MNTAGAGVSLKLVEVGVMETSHKKVRNKLVLTFSMRGDCVQDPDSYWSALQHRLLVSPMNDFMKFDTPVY